jgi:hypothetical protein
MKIYSRAHKVAEGKRLAQQDALRHRNWGGGLRWNAPGSFVNNPYYGVQPSQAMQVPPLSGPGGYTHTPNATTGPAEFMAAQAAQPHAHGGAVDNAAYENARQILEGARRACGGQVDQPPPETPRLPGAPGYIRARGGPTQFKWKHRSPRVLLAALKQIELDTPRATQSQHWSYWAQKCPEIRHMVKELLQDGRSRSGAYCTIIGALTRMTSDPELNDFLMPVMPAKPTHPSMG